MNEWLARLIRSIELPPELRSRLARTLEPYGFRAANHSLPDRAVWQGGPDGIPMAVRVTRGAFGVLLFETPAGFGQVALRDERNDQPPLGDPTFDAVVSVEVREPARVLGTLGPAERALLRQAVTEGWQLVDGGWVLTRSDPEAADVPDILERAIALGALARRPAPRGSGLGARLSDPEPGIREAALSLLLATRAWSGEWRALLVSDDPRVVLRAATALRDREVLRSLGQHPDIVLACDAWLALLDLPGSAVSPRQFEPVMCRVLDASRHPPESPPSLAGDARLRLDRLMSALAAVGTPAAILCLMARSPNVLPQEVRRHASATIAAIRARYTPERGTLALADDGDPRGRLGLADPPPRTPR